MLHTSQEDEGVVKCPICHQSFSDTKKLKQHIPNCSPKKEDVRNHPATKVFQRLPSNQGSDSDSSSDNYDDESSECEDVEIRRNPQGQIVFSRNVWLKCPLQTVDKVPNNIDKLSCYSVYSNSRSELLEKCRDGRPWQHDTRTKWAGYDTVRYKNCNGMPVCPNNECLYKSEFGTENSPRFDRSNKCTICGATGEQIACPARKYTAFKGGCAHIFHHGTHTCEAKQLEQRPVELVASSIAVNPSVKPSTIQGNAILADMRSRKSWNDVQTTVKRVANKRAIANEKAKQKKQVLQKGDNFEAVKEYKKYTDSKDDLLVYVVDKNNQHVFKTSTVQMNVAKKMSSDSSHPLAKEFCCFDGKAKRTKNFVTLTASVYHSLLQRQIPLAIMECKNEDSQNVEVFWCIFNKAFKEANKCEEKFTPFGWATDMATANFIGLEQMYGEEIRNKIKGCEFHYRYSVNRHS